MRSASAEPPRPLGLAPVREWLPAAALTLLLTLVTANSTVQSDWVHDSGRATLVALTAVLVVGALALVPSVPWAAGLGVLLAGGPVSGWLAARDLLPTLTGRDEGALAALGAWSDRIASGAAFSDRAVLLLLLAGLAWLGAGWLAWCVLRWRQPLFGMLPLGLVLATNVLNAPNEQNGPVLGFLLLCCGLLLWCSYLRSVDGAARRGLRLAADVRWSFWELGVGASVAVLVLGIFVPPLSTTDRTVSIQSGLFRQWAQIQQGLDHPVPFGPTSGPATTQGFSSDVQLGGPLHRTGDVVLTYTTNGDLPGPYYFRGVDLLTTQNGEWRWNASAARQFSLPGNGDVPWAERYQDQRLGSIKVQMVQAPASGSRVLFYPGTLERVDQPVRGQIAAGVGVSPESPNGRAGLPTLDRVDTGGQSSRYTVTVAASTATDVALRQAGTAYPSWVEPYRNFVGSATVPPGSWSAPDASSGRDDASYRSSQTLSRIHDLAVQVTGGTTNSYDAAAAIETYLRAQYRYTLKPNAPPRGQDALAYFLFRSQEGYCEYFATAMGDMLRSLGIPVRLVNGFGPGQFDQKQGRFVVRQSDAHTWPEVYFPRYGWIPFEPTPDGTYFPIPRGAPSGAVCGENGQCAAGTAAGAAAGQPALEAPGDGGAGLGGAGSSSPSHPAPFPWQPVVAGLAAFLAAAFLVVSRWLRPRRIQSIWERFGVLARLAGVPPRRSETPLEFSERLARALPPAAEPARELARQFTLAAYAPAGTPGTGGEGAADAWAALRGRLLRGALGRLASLLRRES